jgi:hypothetical protein
MPKPVADWPLHLCGPMLRRVTPESVSVFVALRHPRKVRLSALRPGNLRLRSWDRYRAAITGLVQGLAEGRATRLGVGHAA